MPKTNGQVQVFDLLKDETDNEILIDEQDVVYTETFRCEKNVNYSFELLFDSYYDEVKQLYEAISCKIEIEQGNIPPVTEGAADVNMVVPDDAPVFFDEINDRLVHIKAYPPAVSRFLRLKITGLVGNSESAKLVRCNVCTIVNL